MTVSAKYITLNTVRIALYSFNTMWTNTKFIKTGWGKDIKLHAVLTSTPGGYKLSGSRYGRSNWQRTCRPALPIR